MDIKSSRLEKLIQGVPNKVCHFVSFRARPMTFLHNVTDIYRFCNIHFPCAMTSSILCLILSNENAQIKKITWNGTQNILTFDWSCMILLIPYFGWSDYWSWKDILIKRNKFMYRFVTFELFKWPANQARS